LTSHLNTLTVSMNGCLIVSFATEYDNSKMSRIYHTSKSFHEYGDFNGRLWQVMSEMILRNGRLAMSYLNDEGRLA
jgi:hypothetical protein